MDTYTYNCINELTECDVNFVKYILVDKYNDSFTYSLIV